MISKMTIYGLPEDYFDDREMVVATEDDLIRILLDFLSKVKSDSSIRGTDKERSIRTQGFFPIYYPKDAFPRRKCPFVTVEVCVASCVITESVYWMDQLTSVLRRFFSSLFPSIKIRYEVAEVKFVDDKDR